jgi:Rrf2 family protein
MVYLSTSKDLVSIRAISEATGISSGYLEQLMIPLRRAGLVTSQRGVQGGYTIAREKITCYDVLLASEGVFTPTPCKDCDQTSICKTHRIWALLENAVLDYAKNVYIEDLAGHLLEDRKGGGM